MDVPRRGPGRTNEQSAADVVRAGLSEAGTRERVIRLVFAGRRRCFEDSCEAVAAGVPPDTAAVLRGSAVTAVRHLDGAPFDADGPGTSDLDLTLVGSAVLDLFDADVAGHEWHHPGGGRLFLEIVTSRAELRVFGVHLSAVHSNWIERRRARGLRALLGGIERHSRGFHLVVGDFNTLAPGETLGLRKLPARLRAVAWVTGRKLRWETIRMMLDASYVDAFRLLHTAREKPGYTFPTWDPHVRLDFAFLPAPWIPRLQGCSVAALGDAVMAASDHLPLLVELDAG